MVSAVQVYSKTPNVAPLIIPILNYDGVGPFYIKNIKGLGPVKATINSKAYGLLDGEYYTGSHIGSRNIVLTIGVNPVPPFLSIADLRKELYGYLRSQLDITLKFPSAEEPLVQIDGYVESFEHDTFEKDLEVQVSIICPKPYFLSDGLKSVSGVASPNPVPTSFYYDAQATNGIIFQLTRDLSNDYIKYFIRIELTSGVNPYRKFQVVGTVNSTKYFYLDSHQGIKIVETRSVATGLRVDNLLGSMTSDSLWPYVVPGMNKIKVTSSWLNLPWTMYYRERFGGL